MAKASLQLPFIGTPELFVPYYVIIKIQSNHSQIFWSQNSSFDMNITLPCRCLSLVEAPEE